MNEPSDVVLPTEVTAPVRLAFVMTFPAVKPAAEPVMFVPTSEAGVPSAGATSTMPVLVQALMLPLATVPSAGVTSVGLVNNSALVSCLVVPDWTIGKTSVVAAKVAAGSAVIAMVVMLVISRVNVKTLSSRHNCVRH